MARRAREELHAMFERDFVALRTEEDPDLDRDGIPDHGADQGDMPRQQ
jgi:hypothetical protein